MEHSGEYYYKLNRFALSLIGLWPYQSKWSAHLVRAVLTILLISSIIFQLASIFKSNITMDFLFEMIPIFILMLGALIHLYVRVRQTDKLRDLFEHIWNDWKLQMTRYEIKILREYANTSRLFTLYFLIFAYTILFMYYIWMFMPDILDIISPINESRPRIQPFKVDFFIDEERYFYLIRSHICLLLFAAPQVVFVIVTLFVALMQHACGMCELLGSRAERLFCIIEGATKYDSVRSKISCGNMIDFIRLHYNVTQASINIYDFLLHSRFINLIEIYQSIPFFVDLVGLVLVMSLVLTQMLRIADLDVEKTLRLANLAIVILICLCIFNYMGQKITDMSSRICEKVYNSAWYYADVSKQKSLLLIMNRRFHPLILTACKFYVMSLPNLGMVFRTVISYCMFMRQF